MVEPVLAWNSDIKNAINYYFASKERVSQAMETLSESKEPLQVISQEAIRIEDEDAPAAAR